MVVHQQVTPGSGTHIKECPPIPPHNCEPQEKRQKFIFYSHKTHSTWPQGLPNIRFHISIHIYIHMYIRYMYTYYIYVYYVSEYMFACVCI